MSEQYTCLAQVYDNFMYDVSYADWAEYIRPMLRGNRVLEYACGTGSLTLELAKMGYDICAVDISEDMLHEAAKKLRKNALEAKLMCEDMAVFELNKPVDCAVCACDGVNYIIEERRLTKFFESVYKNILTSGVFLFDISSEHKLADILGEEFFYDDSDEGTLFWQNSYDRQKRLISMDISMFVPNGDVYHRYEERHIQRAWRIGEINTALAHAGFKDIKIMKFMTDMSPDTDCERIQFVTYKGDFQGDFL